MTKRLKIRTTFAFLGLFIFISTISRPDSQAISYQNDRENSTAKWTQCPLKQEDGKETAECTQITVPMHHDAPEGSTINVAVKRKLGKIPHKRQLWFLDGGPGDSGRESLAALAKVFADVDDLDIYTFDHRGVGGTRLLDCPEQQRLESEGGREILASEWEDCIRYLRQHRSDLDALTTTETAQDLGLLIELFRESKVPVFVMGVSYGSYLANRYLQLFPHQPDGVILDGLVPADWSFAEFDGSLDQEAREFLAECDKDPNCANHFRSNLSTIIEELIQDLDDSQIKRLGLTGNMLRLLLGNMLMIDATRLYIPALLIRLERFSWYDKMTILHLFRLLSEEEGIASEPSSHSQVLQRHIALSELWGKDAPPPKKFEEAIAGTIMTTRVSASFASTAENWPVYDAGPFDDTFADYDGPLLMLHGDLDPTIPPQRLDSMRRNFSAPHQHFILIPQGGHVVINESPCVRFLYRQFLDNPAKAPDTSCIAEIPPLSFSGEDRTSLWLFGTTDYWGSQVTWGMRMLKLIFHVPAMAIGVIFFILGVFIIRETSPKSQNQKPYFRMALAAVIWFIVCLLWRLGGILLPYLFDYRAFRTIAFALILSCLQVAIGVLLLRWMRHGPPFSTNV